MHHLPPFTGAPWSISTGTAARLVGCDASTVLEAAGISKRGPYHLRHTFATEALAAGVSTSELSRVMGTSVAMIDQHYGHLARDSEESIRARLDARSRQSGVYSASEGE